ncbi:MAG: 30S ribosomal protein S12 methylthiotransferase RimO [Betaproteobacteria bacterium]
MKESSITKKTPSVGFVSLGCPKATVDSERIITTLRSDGYSISPTYRDADLVIINTCGFVDSAIEESLDAIGEAVDQNGKVIVTGCLGAKSKIIEEKFPNLLAITGPQATDEVMQSVRKHIPIEYDYRTSLVPPQGIKLTPEHYSYLKISEGCNHACTFCIIPSMRGKLVSRPIGNVLNEAKTLVESGTKELLVISQDTSAYGVDTKYRTGFWNGKPVKTQLVELARELGQLEVWVRLHYVYPYPNVDDIIPLMADGLVLPYLDIPFQHASERVLRSMKRPAHSENVLNRLMKWRKLVPDLSIRSTFIVGFPGETEEDFNELLTFLSEANLDRVGCFEYSPVEGATANDLGLPQVPDEIKSDRKHRFMEHQQHISKRKLQSKIGTVQAVIIDQAGTIEMPAVGRTKYDAPEIDGTVILEGKTPLRVGEIINAKISGATEYDLIGSPAP